MQKKYIVFIIAAAILLGATSFLSFKKPVDPELANWKMYTSEKYEFEVYYPSDWKEMPARYSEDGVPSFRLVSSPDLLEQSGPCEFFNTDHPEYAVIGFGPMSDASFDTSFGTSTQVNGYPAQRLTSAGNPLGVDFCVTYQVSYQILKKGKSFSFWLNTPASPGTEQYNK